MSDKHPMLHAIGDLEKVLGQSAGLSEGLDDHRKQGIFFRRQIAEKVALIASLGEQTFDTTEEHTAFRSEFSKMRSAMALHQASWPVVSIKPDDPEYLASLQSLRQANTHFISWTRRALAGS